MRFWRRRSPWRDNRTIDLAKNPEVTKRVVERGTWKGQPIPEGEGSYFAKTPEEMNSRPRRRQS